MSTKKRFSLIEILVVMAILLVLLAFLMPGLNRMSDLARQIKCMNQLKQLGFATHQYLDDNRGFFGITNYGGWHGQLASWMMHLYPYVINEKAPSWAGKVKKHEPFGCPEVFMDISWGSWMGDLNSTYGLNWAIGQKDGNNNWFNHWYGEYGVNRINDVGAPDSTHLISDNGYIKEIGGAHSRHFVVVPTSYWKPGPRRHNNNEGGAVLMMDGSVEYRPKEHVAWPTSWGATAAELEIQQDLFHPDK